MSASPEDMGTAAPLLALHWNVHSTSVTPTEDARGDPEAPSRASGKHAHSRPHVQVGGFGTEMRGHERLILLTFQ